MANLTRIVQDIYANFGRGDAAAIVDTFCDDIHFIHSGGPEIPYAKDRRGKQEAAKFFDDLAASVEVTLFGPRNFVEQGDTVVALGHWGGRARATGKSFDSDWAMVWTFEGTKVKFYQAFENTKEVAKAFAT